MVLLHQLPISGLDFGEGGAIAESEDTDGGP
jgi:hypothetical protein